MIAIIKMIISSCSSGGGSSSIRDVFLRHS